MIPGNRPEDMEWESFHNWIDDQCEAHALSSEDARVIWLVGFAARKQFKDEVDKQLADLKAEEELCKEFEEEERREGHPSDETHQGTDKEGGGSP